VKRTLRKARLLLGVTYAEMMEYRAELYLWALSGIMPFILMGLWAKAAGETPMGMPPVDFVRYFLAVFVVRQMTMVWVVWDFEYDVVNGQLSPRLLHPLNPVWRYVASHVGERFSRIPFVTALMGIFFLLYPKAWWVPAPGTLALAILAMLVAFIMRFVMQYAFAMLAFWTERANAIEDLWFTLYLFLSGYIAPLEMFPPAVREATLYTPFPYLVYVPAKLLAGQPVPALTTGFLVTLAWGLVFLALQQVLWRTGLRRYSAMGA